MEKIGAAVFGGIPVGVVAWMYGEHFCLDKNAWASWVQAIRLIGAIGGAVWIASEQKRQCSASARKALLERNVSLCTRLRSITDEVALIAGASLDLATDGFEVRRRRARLLPRIGSDLHYRMARFEADEIEPIRVTVLFKLREVLGRFDRTVEAQLRSRFR